jgi:glutaryl-CoA dehydrogenase
VLRGTRHGSGWEITGAQMGAYENALKYAQTRLQFGKPIGSFQLIQELLAKMLSNIVACQCLLARSVQLEAEGKLTDAQAAIAKAFCTSKARVTESWSTTTWLASLPMPRLSIPTKARTRCRT